MPHEFKLSTASVNVQADAWAAAMTGGYLRLYTGVKPKNADVDVTNQQLCAELSFSRPAFKSAVDGELVAVGALEDPSAHRSGKVTWYRLVKADGTTKMGDGTAGKQGSGSDLELGDDYVVGGAPVKITSFKHTVMK